MTLFRSHLRFLFKPRFLYFQSPTGQSSRPFSTSQILRTALDMPPPPVDTTQRLAKLRELMKQNKVDVYIVPSEDSHQSEYIAPCDGRRAFISGFTGSAGCAIVSMSKAALSTDGRYFSQAAKQLDANWKLLKRGVEGVPTWEEWTAEQAENGKVVGVDPSLITAADARKLSQTLKATGGSLVGIDQNLIDIVWGDERPARPVTTITVQPVELAGKPFEEKVEALRKELATKKRSAMVISAEIYVDDSRLSPEARKQLEGKVVLKPYDAIFQASKVLAESKASASDGAASGKFLLSNKASWSLSLALGGEQNVDEVRSPITDAKAIKNDVELEGFRKCHIRDGAALIEYFAWLENALIKEGAKLDEVDGADKLYEIRKKYDLFVGNSFDTISSTGANGAIIHYKPEKSTCSVIDPKAMYLCDSGGQYKDGTTDTTRTLHFGEPTEFQKKAYALVLKGHISIDNAIFPKGTTGYAIDSFARQHLWREGLDYLHGTGHGVGSFLNVHEGPMGIGSRAQYAEVPLSAKNVLSNEPGYYEDGNFGIRLENLVICKEVETTHKFGDKPFLGFEYITMVPFCQKLLDASLLTEAERKWVNDYHAKVWEKTSPFFEKDELTLNWLKRETQPI
ncbi:aminopeptidase P [Microsporum canis CBS 113480]|uniref:Probable Xaa-Pro aminopeptidase P n=1 Tax=Arthroderma otae (strain ATCC MYA-4605 / CBS 113480) TaxID=554155 RepID=AMPP1_ARTOC|nr:aminopeptidase P [Microsporum canis CBS 113480]C5FHR9.1 RecName: Full=Probable Xaa-Pro aminopeptidase P; Short=AMPP; Short=Aminopeptidase P; AltName: Full=Aminoacylproline aminopeptidase; AltName: Full=Prolidase [Microsporum canis CBS 113480]EEQ28899.1 aminopeptidase P [Microsporum canis CBS 113480]